MEEDIYITLIYKRLAGEISEAENGQLEAWLQQAEANMETLENVTTAWAASEDLTPEVQVDLDQEFAFLEQRIQADDEVVKPDATIRKIQPSPQKSNRRTWLMAASILFLGVSVFLLRDFFTSSSSDLVEVQSQDQLHELTLPDGSTVVLNKNSALIYDKNFSGSERKMELKGEAFFDVTPDKSKPFKVKFANSEVEVLGTSFNIRARAEEDQVVQVMSGSVQWHNPAISKVLSPGTTATLDRLTGKLTTRKKGRINANFWQSKQLEFDEIELKYAIEELERLFDVQFSELPDSLVNCRFTATFDNPSLEEILETLATVFAVEVIKIDNNNYQLKGGDCQ